MYLMATLRHGMTEAILPDTFPIYEIKNLT